MFQNYLKIAGRNLIKYRSFSLINIIGLSLGLASIMVLAFMLYQFLTVNNQFQNQERMYYIRAKNADGKLFKQTPYPFLDEVVKACPEVEAGTHIQNWSWPWLSYNSKEFQGSTWYVDSAFLQVFTYPLLYGNAATALQDKQSVVISAGMAKKLFGDEKLAVGKTIAAEDSLSLTVTGVLQEVPSNTTLKPEVLLTTTLLKTNPAFLKNANWYNSFAENYLLLKPGADITRLNQQLNTLAGKFFHDDIKKNKLQLAPFTDFVKNEGGDTIQVIIKGISGTIAFILLILIANLINLNAATMFSRAKEVAVKKMMGSSKRQIVWQFCIENAMIIGISLVLAFLLFTNLLVPQVNKLVENNFGTIYPDIKHDYPLALWFVLGGVIIVIIAGCYPAFHLNSLKVTDVVKGQVNNSGKKHHVKNIFITVQFALAITFIGITILLNKQMSHMKSAALGFNKEDILVVPINLDYKSETAAAGEFDAFLNELRANPYIKNISTRHDIPTRYRNNYNTYYDPATNREINMRHAQTDAGLIPTYQIALAAGRNFKNISAETEGSNVIINRTAMKALGWEQAIGKQLKSKGNTDVLTVIGVTEDYYYQDLTRSVEPLVQYYGGEQQLGYTYLSVKIDAAHTNDIVQQLQERFKKMPSHKSFSYEFLDARIDKQYTLLNGILKVTNYVSLLTIFIACMGLFGLVALFTKQRVKEIGIRKVLGADALHITRLLSQNYVILILIASAIATPLVCIVMSRWLQDFAYRIHISWTLPALGGLAALGVALCIVAYQAIKAATANPVKSLRTE